MIWKLVCKTENKPNARLTFKAKGQETILCVILELFTYLNKEIVDVGHIFATSFFGGLSKRVTVSGELFLELR